MTFFWNIYSPGTKQRLRALANSAARSTTFLALDVVIADCRIEITEAQAGTDERHDRQARALILSDTEQRQIGSFAGKRRRRCPPDSAISAGNQYNFAF